MSMFFGYDMAPGLIPLVVGVVSTPEGLEKAAAAETWPCDVVEIRLDLIGDESCDWPVAALRLTKAGMGTLLTVRHTSEGGRWAGDEQARLDAYIQGLPHVTGIDIELSAEILPDVIAQARGKVTTIGSFHNFRAMPDAATLQRVISQGNEAGVDVIKIAGYAQEKAEVTRLLNVIKKNADRSICAVGMGPMGLESRIQLALAGSCLTYGYLDKSNANGQPAAADIRAALIGQHEEYRLYAEARG
jgi:3-dehydroquinate dehydratase type I